MIWSSRYQDDRYAQKVVVELKHQLKNKTELDRLVGQVLGYKQSGYDKALVVSVDPELNMHEVLKNRESTEGLAGFLILLAKHSNPDLQSSV